MKVNKPINKLTECLMVYGWKKPKNELAHHQKDPKYLPKQLKLIESVNPQLSITIARSITNAYKTSKTYHFNHINNKPGWKKKDGRNDRRKIEYILASTSYIDATLRDINNYYSKDHYIANGKLTHKGKEFLSRFDNMGKILAEGKALVNHSELQNKARAPKQLKSIKPQSKPETFEDILKDIN